MMSNDNASHLPISTQNQNLPIGVQNYQNRRSSSRSIKRKRFDDEIVEYSISFPSRNDPSRSSRPRTTSQTLQATPPVPLLQPPVPPAPVMVPQAASAAVEKAAQSSSSTVALASAPAAPTPAATTSAGTKMRTGSFKHPERKRSRRSQPKKTKKTKSSVPAQITTKDLGRWKPVDDLALIIGILQAKDLRVVHRATKFSCKFTLSELQARWHSLLYEPAISRISVTAMRNLHPESMQSVERKAPFSVAEEELLSSLKSVDNPKLEQFQELLNKHSSVFFSARTAKSLQNHWQVMKQYQLLSDQVVKPVHISDHPMSFSEAEDLILDSELNDPRDETLEIELSLADRQNKRKIRLLENGLARWNVLVDSMSSVVMSPEFDGQTLAVLRGRLVRYLMRSKEISFGRDAKDCVVDVDLSLEGPATKISRRHGTIKLRSNGDFFIANEGRRPIFINGVPLLSGNKTRLGNNCVVEISGLRFVFLVNYELINAIRHESAKTTSPLN